MKPYVAVTGVVFGLIALAHVMRVIAEGTHLLRDPVFMGLTAAAVGLAVWAWRAVRQQAGR